MDEADMGVEQCWGGPQLIVAAVGCSLAMEIVYLMGTWLARRPQGLVTPRISPMHVCNVKYEYG